MLYNPNSIIPCLGINQDFPSNPAIDIPEEVNVKVLELL